jgi:hypothetical protein
MLYKFKWGDTYHNFTSTLFSKVFNGDTYYPTTIKDGELTLSDNIAKSSMVVTFSIFNTFAIDLLHETPETPVELIMYKNELPYWQGVVESVKRNFGAIVVQCTSIDLVTRGNGAHYILSLFCNHKLYSNQCAVNRELWRSEYTVNATTNVLEISGLVEADHYFDNGMAVMGTQSRRIIKQVGIEVTLSSAFTGNPTGTIVLYPGCELTESACKRFNNIENGLMFARVPVKNPFGTTGLL